MGGFSIWHLIVLVVFVGVPVLVVMLVVAVIRVIRSARSQPDEARVREIVREELARHEQSRPRT